MGEEAKKTLPRTDKTLPEAEGSISSSDKKANVSKPPSSRPPINTTLPDDPEEK
ncbi:11389_t:CDS:2 [Entrophospora sp. SA101]|nr:777_t:CDS:2 [Entrophospora sp. SA101]CAJ0919005.1 11389_t:CDS:2 [Entrophospora sp. SA101]